ncbi:MAG: hypothetical protein JW739_00035 [Opitutales bacterium]|nr:hypothetical protein [Opitutales bacterium]
MSVIFGIFNRKGNPIGDEVDTMYGAMKRFPHESHAIIRKGNCAFGHMLTYNTPEARYESMPIWFEQEQTLFVCEGRIDNRQELFEVLKIPLPEQPTMSDGSLMLQAYLKWGEECIHKFLGKWSLSVFQARTQELFLARDKFDYTCLHYFVNEEYVVFASSPYGLTALPLIGKEINLETFAGLMVIIPDLLKEHIYKHVRTLQPSHFAKYTREKHSIERYWSFYNWQPDRTRKWADHVEEMFYVFNLAVKDRLRSEKPVAGTLSGGLDSSTVCSLAAEHLAKQGKRLTTYTHVPLYEPSASLGKNIFGDERPFVEDIVKASGHIDPIFLNSDDISVLEGIERGFDMAGGVIPAVVNAYWLVDIFSRAQKAGVGAMLQADFGNSNISWTVPEYLLPMPILRDRVGLLKAVKKKYIRAILYGNNPLGKAYKGVVGRKSRWQNRSYLTSQFCDKLKLEERLKASDFPSNSLYHFTDPIACRNLIYEVNAMRLLISGHMGLFCGMEVRDPCTDIRVIEAFTKIPHELFLQDQNRWLVRDMMQGRLPESVRLNPGRGRQSSDVGARIFAQRKDVEARITAMMGRDVERYIDVTRLENAWQQCMAQDTTENTFDLIQVFTLMRYISAGSLVDE